MSIPVPQMGKQVLKILTAYLIINHKGTKMEQREFPNNSNTGKTYIYCSIQMESQQCIVLFASATI